MTISNKPILIVSYIKKFKAFPAYELPKPNNDLVIKSANN